jgi:hypothetical protein
LLLSVDARGVDKLTLSKVVRSSIRLFYTKKPGRDAGRCVWCFDRVLVFDLNWPE